MRIEFEQEDKEHIQIIGITEKGERSEIGHIFTPSGSGERNLNAIQICGFDEAFDLWGCGVYGDAEQKQMKKDIQLCWFRPYKHMTSEEIRSVVMGTKEHKLSAEAKKMMKSDKDTWTETLKVQRFSAVLDCKICGKCFNYPCSCEIKTRFENPYTIKREQDLYLDKKKVEDNEA